MRITFVALLSAAILSLAGCTIQSNPSNADISRALKLMDAPPTLRRDIEILPPKNLNPLQPYIIYYETSGFGGPVTCTILLTRPHELPSRFDTVRNKQVQIVNLATLDRLALELQDRHLLNLSHDFGPNVTVHDVPIFALIVDTPSVRAGTQLYDFQSPDDDAHVWRSAVTTILAPAFPTPPASQP